MIAIFFMAWLEAPNSNPLCRKSPNSRAFEVNLEKRVSKIAFKRVFSFLEREEDLRERNDCCNLREKYATK